MSPPSAAAGPDGGASDWRARVRLLLPGGREVQVWVAGDDFVLAAAREQGVALPSLCEQGWCCACAVRVLAGRLDQSASRRFYPEDRAAGFALICTGRPRSDLCLQTHALAEMRAHRDACGLPAPRGPTLPAQ